MLSDEGKLIGLELNRSLRDEHGEIYDIVAGTFLVVGLGEENFTSLPPEMIQKYSEQFKKPELFANINGQLVSIPVEPENPLRTAEMTLEDDYGMIARYLIFLAKCPFFLLRISWLIWANGSSFIFLEPLI